MVKQSRRRYFQWRRAGINLTGDSLVDVIYIGIYISPTIFEGVHCEKHIANQALLQNSYFVAGRVIGFLAFDNWHLDWISNCSALWSSALLHLGKGPQTLRSTENCWGVRADPECRA